MNACMLRMRAEIITASAVIANDSKTSSAKTPIVNAGE